MLKYIIILFVIVFVFFLIKNKYRIKFNTFLHKGFRPERSVFGVYCYCGKQGSGKTYSVVEFLYNNKNNIIYSNISSLKGIDFRYINGLKQLLELRKEHDIIIVYDEIFTEISKIAKLDAKTARDVMDFLSQMRKRKIILLTTCQEWAELPITFRRYVRYQINCKLINVPFFKGILIKNILNGEDLHWSTEDNDFIATLIENTISHTQLRIANSYDTFEQIGSCATLQKEVAQEQNVDTDFWGTNKEGELIDTE